MSNGAAMAMALRGTFVATAEKMSAETIPMRLGMPVSCWTCEASAPKSAMMRPIEGVMPSVDMARSVSAKIPIFDFVT